MIKFRVPILGTLLFLASPAFSAEQHSHVGRNGGTVVESGHHHLEVVTKDGSIEVHVNGEDGKPEDVKDARAKATVLSGGQKEEIVLSPDPANTLKGTGKFRAIKGTTIVITLTMPGHDAEQARIKLD